MGRAPDWEPVWQGNGEAQAQIIVDGLVSRGFPARAQGARQIQGGLPTAFQLNTWAVFVPTQRADDARDLLRKQGEEAGVTVGGGQSTSDIRATLRFFGWLAAGCVLFGVFIAVREAL